MKYFEIYITTRYLRTIFAEECRNFQQKASTTLTTDRRFSELVILVVKGNAALSDVQGFSPVYIAGQQRFSPGLMLGLAVLLLIVLTTRYQVLRTGI